MAPSSRPKLRVLISYTRADIGWARWIESTLRKKGYETRLDIYDFVIAKSLRDETVRALSWADKVLCLISTQYLSSEWARRELRVALEEEKFFGVRLDDVSLTGVVKERLVPSLRDLGRPGGHDPKALGNALVNALRSGTVDTRGGTVPFPGFSNALWRVPEARNGMFHGRASVLESVHEALTGARFRGGVVVLHGEEPAGKSEIALEYAFRYRSEYDAVVWFRASDSMTLAVDLVSLATDLSTVVADDPREQLARTMAALSATPRALWIFDDVVDRSIVAPYLPSQSGPAVLVTARRTWSRAARAFEIGEFSEDDALGFLLRRASATRADAEAQAAREIFVRVGGLPSVLEQVAVEVEERGLSLGDYARRLRRPGVRTMTKSRDRAPGSGTAGAWKMSFERAGRQRGASELLNLSSFVASDGLNLTDFREAWSLLPAPLQTVARGKTALDKAALALSRYSLARRLPSDGSTASYRISVSSSVQQAVRQRLGASDRRRWQKAALRVVEARFPVNGWDTRNWPECTRLVPHAEALLNEPGIAKLDADAVATLCNRLAVYLAARGQQAEVQGLYQRAIKAFVKEFGPNDTRLATVLSNHAMSLLPGEPKKAAALLHRALRIDRRRYGTRHPYIATYLNNLALVSRQRGQNAEAERLLREALTIFEGARELPPDTARALNNLGDLLTALGKHAEAELLLRRALAIDEGAFGAEHPRSAADLLSLAMLLSKTERAPEAELLCRRALAIRVASLGEQHPKTMEARQLLQKVAGVVDRNRRRLGMRRTPEPKAKGARDVGAKRGRGKARR
jgi:tetratricopeptide (TPR) repeat protein